MVVVGIVVRLISTPGERLFEPVMLVHFAPLVWALLCWLAARRAYEPAVGVYLLGLLPLLGATLHVQEQSLNELQLGSIGVMTLLTLANPLVFLTSLLFGLPTSLVACALGLLSLSFAPNLSVGEWVLGASITIAGALIGTFVHRLLIEIEHAYSRLERMALVDTLTGLGNRRALERDFDRLSVVALSMFDIDNLKLVNDHEGHAAGDALILSFAAALRETFAEHCLYRTGGDEFVVLHETPITEAEVSERVRQRFAGVSLGCVVVVKDSLDRVLVRADTRLYEDKARRKATLFIG